MSFILYHSFVAKNWNTEVLQKKKLKWNLLEDDKWVYLWIFHLFAHNYSTTCSTSHSISSLAMHCGKSPLHASHLFSLCMMCPLLFQVTDSSSSGPSTSHSCLRPLQFMLAKSIPEVAPLIGVQTDCWLRICVTKCQTGAFIIWKVISNNWP